MQRPFARDKTAKRRLTTKNRFAEFGVLSEMI